MFRTYEPTRDRLVAVKAFRLDIVPEQAQALAAGLSRAAQASLCHPSIVEPIEAGVEGTVAYRAEEYVAAESLDVAMRHYAPAPIEKVLPFITQLAGAIDFARAAGIGHGGLHPRDIFVTPDEARATGFGVVDALEQVGIRAPIRRPYSPPERIDGRAWGTQADVFSLAAITFELLTGKRPSGTGAQIGTLPEGDHSAALHAVLARAMDDDPSARHTSALGFASALEAASQGRRVTDAVPVVTAIAAAPSVPAEPVTESDAILAAPGIVKPEVPKRTARRRAFAEPVIAPPARVEPVPPAEPAPIVHDVSEDVVEKDAGADRAGALSLFDLSGEAAENQVEDEKTARQDGNVEPDVEVLKEAAIKDEEDEFALSESPVEAAMFHSREPEVGLSDAGDQGRPAILPFAVVGVLMLLVGFAGGYYVASRQPLAPPAAPESTEAAKRPATTPSSTGSAGPATAEKAGQYSEQKISPAPPPAFGGLATPASGTAAAASAAARPAAPPPVPAVTRGEILVRSQPSHAGVTVNGTWRGRTPLTLDNLTFGSYAIRVVQAGYKVARDEVTLSAREPSKTVTARLEPTSPAAPAAAAPVPAPMVTTGTLYVDSRPRGAMVTVDGKSAGQTPLMLPEVSAGSHVVRIEMDGKKPVTANRRVVAGQTERVTISLEDK